MMRNNFTTNYTNLTTFFIRNKSCISLFFFIFSLTSLNGQTADFYFDNDTVCTNEPVKLFNASSGASSYQWIFESAVITPNASYDIIPDVFIPANKGPVYIASAREGMEFYTFTCKHTNPASIWRQSYGDSYDNTPVNEKIIDIPTGNIEGIDLVKSVDDSIWYGLVSGGTNGDIYRLTFNNGLNNTPMLENLGFSAYTAFPHDINYIYESGKYYAIICNQWDPGGITIFTFNNGLNGSVSTIDVNQITKTELGVNGANLSGLATIKQDGKWYGFAVSTANNIMVRLEFNDDFTLARGFDLGTVNGSLSTPRDVSIVSDCGKLMGFVANVGDNSLSILHFNEGLTGPIYDEKKDFTGVYSTPHAISKVFRFGGEAIVIIPDVQEGKLIRLKFTPNGGHVVGTPDNAAYEPTEYSYDTAGVYFVALSIDNELSSTVCQSIVVIDKPDTPIISSDPVCDGDSLKLAFYAEPFANYTWTLPDNSTTGEKYPLINQSGTYKLTLSYGGCSSPEASENVSVVPLPTAAIDIPAVPICMEEDFTITGNPSGGNPPYSTHQWSGRGSDYLNDLSSPTPIFNGVIDFNMATTYLTDLTPTLVQGTWTENTNVEGGVFMLYYTAYYTGLGTYSGSSIEYSLDGKYDSFHSFIGIDDAVTSCGTAIFKVFTDGVLAYESPLMRYNSKTEIVNVDVTGVNSLELIVEDGGDGGMCDLADWAKARVTINPPHISYELNYSVTDALGCVGTTTEIIDLDTNDVHITQQPFDAFACVNDDILLSVSAFGPGPITYQWQKHNGSTFVDLSNGTNVTGVNSNELSITGTSAIHSGTYRCNLSTSPCGKTTTKETTVLIAERPSVLDSTPGYNCGVGNVTLEASPSSGTIRWYTQATGSTHLFEGNQFTTLVPVTMNFYAEAFAQGCPSFNRTAVEAEIRQVPEFTDITITPASQCDQTDGSISISASPNPGILEYSNDGGNSWQASPTFTNVGIGNYMLSLRYNDGSCTMKNDTLIPVTSLTAPQYLGAPLASEVSDCGATDGSIIISLTGGTGSYLYSIDSGANFVSNGGIFQPLSPGTYDIQIKNTDGTCLVEWHIPIVVEEPEMPSYTGASQTSTSDCGLSDGSLTISATGPSNTIMYSIDSGMNWVPVPTFNNLSASKYTVRLKYINETCLTGVWETFVADPDAPTITSVDYNDVTKCLSANGSINITALPGKGTNQYTINGTDFSPENNYSNLSAGQYIIIAQNQDGSCPQFWDTITILEICNDTMQDIVCRTNTESDLMDYLPGIESDGIWNNLGEQTDISGTTINTSELIQGENIFKYTQDSSLFTILLDAYTPYRAGTPGSSSFISCYNQVHLFDALTPGTFDKIGNWYQLDINQKTDSIVVLNPGIYDFAYTTPAVNYCPSDSTLVSIEIDYTAPEISCEGLEDLAFLIPAGHDRLIIDTDSIYPGNISDNCGIQAIINDYNNENTLLGERLPSGEYNIKWQAIDYAGNIGECYTNITVKDFEIPNILTPNDDGKNDIWDFDITENFPTAIVEIYNKWGELVFVSERGYYQKWDGKINGAKAPIDTYFYVIKNNGDTVFKGSITVIYD